MESIRGSKKILNVMLIVASLVLIVADLFLGLVAKLRGNKEYEEARNRRARYDEPQRMPI
jgi:hypothetical protein